MDPVEILVFDKFVAGANTDSLGVRTDVVFVIPARFAEDVTPG